MPRGQKVILVFLILLLITLLRFLYEADKPWERGPAYADAHGKKPKPENYAVVALWWSAWFNVAVAGALILLSG
ncbi:MAG: hypothetical protein AAGD22_17995, partial [Verrucomicrobiota bacterium]